MIKKTLIAGMGFATLLAGHAQAENYYGGNFLSLDYSESGIDDDASLSAVSGRLGTFLNENFSGEFRLGFGLSDGSVSAFGFDVDVELDNMFGAYIRGGFAVSESFYPYVIFGQTRGKLSFSISGVGGNSDTESDTSFGFGADVNIGQGSIVNIEYINYFDKDGVEIDALSIGLARKF